MKKIILLALSTLTVSGAFAQNWVQEQKVVASDRDAIQGYGSSIAVEGDHILVGCPDRRYDDANSIFDYKPGICYFLKNDGTGSWSETQIVSETATPEHKDDHDKFGVDVDISGNYAIIGSSNDDHDANGLDSISDAGSAYIYEYVVGAWVLTDKLLASDRAQDVHFGQSVSISGDMAFVGAQNAVYIFQRVGGTNWQEIQKIQIDSWETTVSVDGNFAIIGAPQDELDENGQQSLSDAGSAYIYEYDGTSWVLENKIDASNRATGDSFGAAVGITPYYAVVGAKHRAIGSDLNVGTAYVFKHNNSSWDEIQMLTAPNPKDGDKYSDVVGISGNDIIIGCYNKTEGASVNEYKEGVAYHYKRLNSWQLQQEIRADDYTYNYYQGNAFGFSASISEDKIVAGAPLEVFDEMGQDSLISAGAVYIFQYDSTVTVNELTNLDGLVLYPNPASDVITIDLGEEVDNGSVSIFNLFGQLVMSETITSGEQLNIQQLPTGTYVFEVTVGEIARKTKLVVR